MPFCFFWFVKSYFNKELHCNTFALFQTTCILHVLFTIIFSLDEVGPKAVHPSAAAPAPSVRF